MHILTRRCAPVIHGAVRAAGRRATYAGGRTRPALQRSAQPPRCAVIPAPNSERHRLLVWPINCICNTAHRPSRFCCICCAGVRLAHVGWHGGTGHQAATWRLLQGAMTAHQLPVLAELKRTRSRRVRRRSRAAAAYCSALRVCSAVRRRPTPGTPRSPRSAPPGFASAASKLRSSGAADDDEDGKMEASKVVWSSRQRSRAEAPS